MRHIQTFRYVDAIAKAGSIRKAAEMLAITQSALNRRILALEEELGVPVFDRLPRGVRLSTAGELLIHHIRSQISDLERVQSQIADLSGVRRGHVSIACSQALIPFFMPQQIARYRRDHAGVRFSVLVRDRDAAERALLDYSADVAIVFEPVHVSMFQTVLSVPQPICAVMSQNHPLSGSTILRLVECLAYPLALPLSPYGVRNLLELAAARLKFKLEPVVQSDSFDYLRHAVVHDETIAFQLPIGLPPVPADEGLFVVPIDRRDVPVGRVHLAHLRERQLPVAAARFLDQACAAFGTHRDFG